MLAFVRMAATTTMLEPVARAGLTHFPNGFPKTHNLRAPSVFSRFVTVSSSYIMYLVCVWSRSPQHSFLRTDPGLISIFVNYFSVFLNTFFSSELLLLLPRIAFFMCTPQRSREPSPSRRRRRLLGNLNRSIWVPSIQLRVDFYYYLFWIYNLPGWAVFYAVMEAKRGEILREMSRKRKRTHIRQSLS